MRRRSPILTVIVVIAVRRAESEFGDGCRGDTCAGVRVAQKTAIAPAVEASDALCEPGSTNAGPSLIRSGERAAEVAVAARLT